MTKIATLGWKPDQACLDHWAQVRTKLKPFNFGTPPAEVFMQISDDERADVEAFKRHRQSAIEAREKRISAKEK